MSPSEYRPARLFTLEQANAMLPLVRAITADLVTLAQDLIPRQQRLELLLRGRKDSTGQQGTDLYGAELRVEQENLQRDTERLEGYLEELRALGVEPKGPQGLIDFPTLLDGRLAYLCWRLGEPEVLFWHDLEAGFSGRQPLTADAAAGDAPPLDDGLAN